MRIAETRRRYAAAALDLVVLSAGIALLLVPLEVALRAFWNGGLTAILSFSAIICVAVAWSYFTVCEASAGCTIGKLAAGLRVICVERHTRPSLRQSAVRNGWRLLDWSLLGVPAARAIHRDPLGRCRGDLKAGTLVVNR